MLQGDSFEPDEHFFVSLQCAAFADTCFDWDHRASLCSRYDSLL